MVQAKQLAQLELSHQAVVTLCPATRAQPAHLARVRLLLARNVLQEPIAMLELQLAQQSVPQEK